MANFFDQFDEGPAPIQNNFFDQYDDEVVEEEEAPVREAIPRGEMRAVEPSSFEKYVADPARRGTARLKGALNTLTRDEDQPERYAVTQARLTRERESYPMTEEQEAGLQAIAESDDLGTFFANVVENPGAIANVIVESAATFAPALLATAVAGPVAGAAGAGTLGTAAAAGLGSGATEYLVAFTDAIGEAGGDPHDPQAWMDALEDEEVMAEAKKKSQIRGVAIGTFDALTAGLAGRFLAAAKPGALGTSSAVSKELGMQMGGGGAGEATAQVASGEEFKLGEVGLEAIAEGPTAAVEVPANIAAAKQGAANTQKARAQKQEGDTAQLQFAAENYMQNPDDPELIQAMNTEMDYFISQYGEEAYAAAMGKTDTPAQDVPPGRPMGAEDQMQLPGMEEQAGPIRTALPAEVAALEATLGPSSQRELGLPTPRLMQREEQAARSADARARRAQFEEEQAAQDAGYAAEAAALRAQGAYEREAVPARQAAAQMGLELPLEESDAYATQRALETGEANTAQPQLFDEADVSTVGTPQGPRAPDEVYPTGMSPEEQRARDDAYSPGSGLSRDYTINPRTGEREKVRSVDKEARAELPRSLHAYTRNDNGSEERDAAITRFASDPNMTEAEFREALDAANRLDADRMVEVTEDGYNLSLMINPDFRSKDRGKKKMVPIEVERADATTDSKALTQRRMAGEEIDELHRDLVSMGVKNLPNVKRYGTGDTKQNEEQVTGGTRVIRGAPGKRGYQYSRDADINYQKQQLDEMAARVRRAAEQTEATEFAPTLTQEEADAALGRIEAAKIKLSESTGNLLENARKRMDSVKPGQPMKKKVAGKAVGPSGVWTAESIAKSKRLLDDLIAGNEQEIMYPGVFPETEQISLEGQPTGQEDMFQPELDRALTEQSAAARSAARSRKMAAEKRKASQPTPDDNRNLSVAQKEQGVKGGRQPVMPLSSDEKTSAQEMQQRDKLKGAKPVGTGTAPGAEILGSQRDAREKAIADDEKKLARLEKTKVGDHRSVADGGNWRLWTAPQLKLHKQILRERIAKNKKTLERTGGTRKIEEEATFGPVVYSRAGPDQLAEDVTTPADLEAARRGIEEEHFAEMARAGKGMSRASTGQRGETDSEKILRESREKKREAKRRAARLKEEAAGRKQRDKQRKKTLNIEEANQLEADMREKNAALPEDQQLTPHELDMAIRKKSEVKALEANIRNRAPKSWGEARIQKKLAERVAQINKSRGALKERVDTEMAGVVQLDAVVPTKFIGEFESIVKALGPRANPFDMAQAIDDFAEVLDASDLPSANFREVATKLKDGTIQTPAGIGQLKPLVQGVKDRKVDISGAIAATPEEAKARNAAATENLKKEQALNKSKNLMLEIDVETSTADHARDVAERFSLTLKQAGLPSAQKVANIGKKVGRGDMTVGEADAAMMAVYTDLTNRAAVGEFAAPEVERGDAPVETADTFMDEHQRELSRTAKREMRFNDLNQAQQDFIAAGGRDARAADTSSLDRGQRSVSFIGEPKRPQRDRAAVKEYGDSITKDQKIGINYALDRLDRPRGGKFLLADGTGFGKTRQMLGVADQLVKNHGGKVLILTPSGVDSAWFKQARADAEAMGINLADRIEFSSYQAHWKKWNDNAGVVESTPYTAVIADEAQSMDKPTGKWNSAVMATPTTRRLYVSATPADSAINLHILAEVNGMTLDQVLDRIGMSVEESNLTKREIELVPKEGVTEEQAITEVAKIYNQSARDGKLIRREYPRVARQQMVKVKASEEAQRLSAKLMQNPNMSRTQQTDAQAKIAEADKAEAAANEAIAAVNDGRKVVIIVDRFVPSEVGGNTIPPVTTELIARLNEAGINNVTFTKKDETGVAVEQFQGRGVNIRTEPDVLITTAQKGGVGIDLDDQVGNKPRTMIFTALPYSSVTLDQAVGRVDRQTTKSIPEIKILQSESMPGDQHRAGIYRLKDMMLNAVSRGIPYGSTKLDTENYSVNFTESAEGNPMAVFTSHTTPTVTKMIVDLLDAQGLSKKNYSSVRREWTMPLDMWDRVRPTIDRISQSAETLEDIKERPGLNETARPEDAGGVAAIKKDLSGDTPANLTEMLWNVAQGLPDGHLLKPITTKLASLGLQVPVTAAKPGEPSTYRVTPAGNRSITTDTDSVTALLHEASHAALTGVLQDKSNPKVQRLNALFELSRRKLNAKFGTDAVGMENYGVTNLDEFAAEAVTNPVFQDQLKSIYEGGQSLWSKFLNAVKVLLGMPTVRNSVLDEVLTLVPSLMETEGEVQLGMMMNDSQQVRELQKPILQQMGIEVGDGTGVVARAMKSATPIASEVMDKIRSSAKLPMMTMRQLAESYGRMFPDGEGNLLQNYVDLMGRKERRAREHQREADFILRKWTEFKNNEPGKNADLSKLMGEVTAAEMHVDKSWNHDDNAHLQMSNNPTVVANNKANFDRLQKQYNAIGKEGQALYGEVKEFFANDWQNTVNLLVRNIVKNTELPFANYQWSDFANKTPAESTARIEGDLNAYLTANPNLDEKVAAEYKATTNGLIEDLREVGARARVKGPYFPLRRFGEYVVEARGKEKSEQYSDRKQAEARRAELESANPTVDVKLKRNDNDTYTVTHRNRSVQFFESKRMAKDAQKKLMASPEFKGGEVSDVTKKEQYHQSKGLNGTVIEKAAQRLDKRGEAALRAAFTQMMPETSIHKAMLRRGSVQGYSEDMRRAFAGHAKTSSHYLAQLEFGQELGGAMRKIDEAVKQKRFSGKNDQVEAADVFDELTKRDEYDVTEMSTSKVLDTASNIGFIWYLLSPSYWMVNATQPHMIATPWLAARSSMVKATAAMTRAYGAVLPEIMTRGGSVVKAAVKGDVDALGGIADFLTEEGTIGDGFKKQIRDNQKYSPKMQEEMIGMLDNLGETGIIDMTFAADLRTAAEGTKAGIIDRTTEWARIMPHLVEVTNRSVTAMAAYELSRGNGKSVAESQKFAEQAVASTQFDYGATNKPRYFSERTSKLLRPILMFMQHSQHMYYMMLRSIAQSVPAVGKRLRGQQLTEAEKAEAAIAGRTFAGIIASHALMAGTIGAMFEPIKWAIGLAALAFGSDDEPWDFETETRKFMADIFGKELGEVVSKGLPTAIGLDMSSRIGLQNLAFFDRGGNDEGREWLESKFFNLAGPLGGIAANFAEAGKNFKDGDYNKAMQQVTPKMFRDMVKAYGLSTNGMLDSTGKTIRPSSDISPLELAYTAAGFQSSEVSNYYAKKNAIMGAKQRFKTQRNRLLERYRRADRGEKKAVWDDIRKFNRQVPRSMRLTRDSILKSEKQTRVAERQMKKYGGVYLQDRERELAKYGDF